MLIQGFLQTAPAIFAIFYHHALGKTSAKKADDQSLSFILGVEIFTAIIFLAFYIATSLILLKTDFINDIFMYVLAGIFVLEAIFMFFFYFRRGKKNKRTTSLFIPRSFSKNILKLTNSAKNRTDTIALGFISSALDLIFTLPLFIIASIQIINLSFDNGFVFIIAYIIIATIPLFTIRTLYRRGSNLAKIQRFRIKNKNFFRLILAVSYLLIAILIIVSELNK